MVVSSTLGETREIQEIHQCWTCAWCMGLRFVKMFIYLYIRTLININHHSNDRVIGVKWFSYIWPFHAYLNTVGSRKNAVNILTNPHNIHPIARPLGRGMGCILWIQTVIHTLPQSLQWVVKYNRILDRVITTLDCISIIKNMLKINIHKYIDSNRLWYFVNNPMTYTHMMLSHNRLLKWSAFKSL